MDRVIIFKDYVKPVSRFNLQSRTLEFKIKSVPDVDPMSWVRKGLEEIILRVTENLKPTDQVNISFYSKALTRGEEWLNFKKASEISMAEIYEVIQRIYQSNTTGLDTGTYCLKSTSVSLPIGQ